MIDAHEDLNKHDIDMLKKAGLELNIPKFVVNGARRVHTEHKKQFSFGEAQQIFRRERGQWEKRLAQAVINLNPTLLAHANSSSIQIGLMMLKEFETPERLKLFLSAKQLGKLS